MHDPMDGPGFSSSVMGLGVRLLLVSVIMGYIPELAFVPNFMFLKIILFWIHLLMLECVGRSVLSH